MDFNDELIELFLEKGYIVKAGNTPAGDPLYKLTEKFYNEQEELVEWLKQQDSDLLSNLWFKGYIDLRLDTDGSGYLYLTDRSADWLTAEDLDDHEKSMMYLIYSTGNYMENK